MWAVSDAHASHCTSRATWSGRASRTAHSTHARHAHAHHGIHLLRHHHEFELFLLHVLSDDRILVYLVLEQRCFELVLCPLVVLEHPIVGYRTDQNRHDHWVLCHYFEILFFE